MDCDSGLKSVPFIDPSKCFGALESGRSYKSSIWPDASRSVSPGGLLLSGVGILRCKENGTWIRLRELSFLI